jgi:hypothetical protein
MTQMPQLDRKVLPTSRARKIGLIAAAWLAAAVFSPIGASAQDNTDPKSIELGAELVDLAGVRGMMNQMMDQIGPTLTQLVVQANPGKEAEVTEVMQSFVLPRMRESVPQFMHEGALLYARHFTNGELGELVAFYKSPVGRKLVAAQPQMMQEMALVAQTLGQKIALDAVRSYSEEFKKRGLQTPI